MVKVVLIAIIKNPRMNFCDRNKRENKKVVATCLEPSTRQRWYADYSARPTPVAVQRKFVMHY